IRAAKRTEVDQPIAWIIWRGWTGRNTVRRDRQQQRRGAHSIEDPAGAGITTVAERQARSSVHETLPCGQRICTLRKTGAVGLQAEREHFPRPGRDEAREPEGAASPENHTV